MNNNIIIRVVILGAFSILGIIAVQWYWVMNTWDVKEQEFHEKVNIALLNVADTFKKLGKPLPTYDLIDRVSSNYYVVNVNDVINANNLEYILQTELEAVGLTVDFEYGIYDCATNQMVYGDYISYSPHPVTEELKKSDLPTYDKFTYYFGLRFPNRTGTILSNMSLTAILSAILFGTLFFFTYSIYVILRQKRMSDMQKDFINNMTHEFKTPISTIKISADVFINNPQVKEDKRLSQYAKIIKEQNQRLNNQVEKVLQLAKVERGNFELNLEEVNLNDLLHKIVESTSIKVTKRKGSLEQEFKATKNIIKADALHLSNVLHNLLDNAMKYCKDVPHITIKTENSPTKKIRLSIIDKGIGIPKEHQHKIFKKFYRVPTGNVHNVKGFGLGLFYIKNICEAHGWKVKLDSEEGKGTKVTITIG